MTNVVGARCARLLNRAAQIVAVGAMILSGGGSLLASPVKASTPEQVVSVETAFDYAMGALNVGKPEAAIPVLQSILAEDPKLTRVRLELARAYFMAEQWARSREEFFRVLSGDLPEPVRKKVLAFIRQIDARRGVDWDLSVGFTTAGNNRSYDADSVDTVLVPNYPLGDRSVNRVPALRANGTVNFRHQLSGLSGPNRNTLGYASLGFDVLDAEGQAYDFQELRARLGLRHLSSKTTASIGMFATTNWLRGDQYEDQFGLEAAFERRGLMGGSAYGRFTFANADNHNSGALDGTHGTAMLGFRRSVAGNAIVGGELSYQRREREGFTSMGEGDYESLQLTAYATLDVRNGWTLRPRVFVRQKNVMNQGGLLIGSLDETAYGGGLRVEKSNTFLPGGYTPYVEVNAERGESGIDAFSYRSVGVELGFERRF